MQTHTYSSSRMYFIEERENACVRVNAFSSELGSGRMHSREKGSPAGLETHAAHYHHYRFTADAKQIDGSLQLEFFLMLICKCATASALFVCCRRQVHAHSSFKRRTQITLNGVDIKVLRREISREDWRVMYAPAPHFGSYGVFSFIIQKAYCVWNCKLLHSQLSPSVERERQRKIEKNGPTCAAQPKFVSWKIMLLFA